MKKLNKKDKNNTSLLYQIRIDVVEDFAIQISTTKNFVFNSKIDFILKKYKAELVCQFNAFEGFVLECERSGNINNPLYKWTKDTILDEVKKKKYLCSFTVYVEGNQIYKKDIADILEREFMLLNSDKIKKINKFNSDPKNNPQPPKKYL